MTARKPGPCLFPGADRCGLSGTYTRLACRGDDCRPPSGTSTMGCTHREDRAGRVTPRLRLACFVAGLVYGVVVGLAVFVR